MKENGKSKGIAGGVVLVILGLFLLVAQFVEWDNMGLWIMPVMAVIFIGWGIVAREPGPMIPGGILGGIGLGTLLLAGPYGGVEGDAEGGVFLLAFAAGWVLITLLTAVFTTEVHWWPLIVAGIMALVGGAVLIGGIFMSALAVLGKIWPLALMALGVYLLFGSGGDKKVAPK